ncbi:phosphatase PAP2 family protein [Actinocrispum sp. NPDC049592]|uniref:phosphatase PAP2 family protein n=1 Tax=Actinocrispum sp. NPDC049592 TaxID=3154835 RepID=UPI003424C9DA
MKKTGAWGLALVAVFLLLGYWVKDTVPFFDADLADAVGNQWVNDPTVGVFTNILGPTMPIVVAVALAGFTILAWVRDQNHSASVLLRCLVVLLACRAVSLFKDVFNRSRPRVYADYAYPSGHTVSVACVAFTTVVLCAWFARQALPWVIGLAVLLVATAGALRIMLGVHWLTDVLGAAIGVTGFGLVVCVLLGLLPARERRVRG